MLTFRSWRRVVSFHRSRFKSVNGELQLLMVAALGLSGQVHSWQFIGAEKRLNPQPSQKEPRSTTVFVS